MLTYSRVSHPLLCSGRQRLGNATEGMECMWLCLSIHVSLYDGFARWRSASKTTRSHRPHTEFVWRPIEGFSLQNANKTHCVTGFLTLVSNAPAFPSTNTQIGTKEVGTVPTLVVLKAFFCGGGVVCRVVSGYYANIAIPTSEWPFLPNWLIV